MEVFYNDFKEVDELLECDTFMELEEKEDKGDVFIFYASMNMEDINDTLENENIDGINFGRYNYSLFDGWFIVHD